MSYHIPVHLPIDLPENWKDTQYVSPNGIEVNLTEQHGYNYLMKQVNNAQSAIIALGKALCSHNDNLLDNSFFTNPVNRNAGYIVPANISYYSSPSLESREGSTTQIYAAQYFTQGVGIVKIGGTNYYVREADMIEGYEHGADGAFGFDRWWGWKLQVTKTLNGKSISFKSSDSSGGHCRQPIVSPQVLSGLKVVMSAFVSYISGTAYLKLYKANKVNSTSLTLVASKQLFSGLNSLTVDMPEDIGNTSYPYLFYTIELAKQSSVDIVAVKLQSGIISTLAYQDDNKEWHLNDIPNKVIETARCNGAPVELGGQGMIVTPADIGAAIIGHGHALTDGIITGILPINKGGTGASDVVNARKNLGFIQGSYTGNGSSSMRTINVGGIGYALVIWSSTNTMKTIITPEGGTLWYDDGAETTLTEDNSDKKCYFKNGNLYLQVKNAILGVPYCDLLNKSGATYYYQVL